MSIVNKHQTDQWLSCHSVSCARLLNIGLNTEVYLYDLKMCDTDYWYAMDWIFQNSHLSKILNLVGLTDSDCVMIIINNK